MRKNIFIVFYLFFATSAYSQWNTIFKDSINYEFMCVDFINNDTGFVGGWAYDGVVFRTFDGGQSWDTTDIFFNGVIMSICFINDSVGFAGGQDGYTIKTVDRGNTWNVFGGSGFNDLASLYFLNDTTGFRFGFNGNLDKLNIATNHWDYYYSSVGRAYFPGTSKFFFLNSDMGFAAQGRKVYPSTSSDGTILKTIDGGQSWNDLSIPINFYPYSCFFFDSLAGFAVGYNGKVSKTLDGGLTWSNPDSLCKYPLYDIHFVSDSIGYIVGGNNKFDYVGSYTNGIIFRTINRGFTWQVMDSGFYNGLTKLSFPSDSVGYAVGMNGEILKITNANSPFTSIQVISNFKNEINIFPNPVSNMLNVELAGTKTLIVSNMLGEIVIEEHFFIPLTEKHQLDVGFLSSGVYFIQTDNMVSRFIKK